LIIRARQKVLKINKAQDQRLPVMVSLKTKNSTEDIVEESKSEMPDNRPSIDLVCCIDTSGSMSGEKIALVIKTLKYLLELLSEDDRLCIITFTG